MSVCRKFILLIEEDLCGVNIQFPIDIQPGTYLIGDHLHQPVVDVFGEYLPKLHLG